MQKRKRIYRRYGDAGMFEPKQCFLHKARAVNRDLAVSKAVGGGAPGHAFS